MTILFWLLVFLAVAFALMGWRTQARGIGTDDFGAVFVVLACWTLGVIFGVSAIVLAIVRWMRQ